MNTNQIDTLRTLYKSDESARQILDAFSARVKQVKFVTVHRLEHATGLARWDVVRILKLLEAHGIGDFVAGRKGKPSRFVFGELSVTSVGQAAAGEVDEIDSLPEEELSEDDDASDWLPADEVRISETHSFVVRPTMKIELPADLSRQEADRLIAFINLIVLG